MKRESLPKGWQLVELQTLRAPGDNTLVGGPFGSELTTSDYQAEPGVPVIRGSNLGGDSGVFVDDGFAFVSEEKASSLLRNMAFPGDVVFTQRGTLGQVAQIPLKSRFAEYVISQSQMKLTVHAKVADSRFVCRYFRSPQALARINSHALATGVPHINLGILKKFPVVLPPLAEQQRIANILDAADALRAKRRAAIEEVDSLSQAIFVEMFGDPAERSKAEGATPLFDLIDPERPISYGILMPGPDQNDGVKYVRVVDMKDGGIELSGIRKTTHKISDAYKRSLLKPDDVLLSIRGHVGRVAIVPYELADANITQDTARLAAARTIVPLFLREYLRTDFIQRWMDRHTKGVAVQGINLGDVKKIPIHLPPLPLQQEFARRIAAVETLKAAHRASLAELDALFASLQHRAFRGEL